MDERLWRKIELAWAAVAAELGQGSGDGEEIGGRARRVVEGLVFRQMCRQRGLPASEMAEPLDERFEGFIAEVLDGDTWPVDVLGSIHERLVGRRLTLETNGRWRIAEHRRTKKNAGVFYTPAYVCQYMAENVLADHQGSLPQRILDPSCGGGAFLLAAYHRLRRQFPSVAPERLAGCLHGVDVDSEAVQVARRSLWLEALTACRPAGKTAQCLAERLNAQITCGDVLLDPAIEAAGPFDVIVGNPPYRRELHTKTFLDRIAATDFGRRYRSPRMDLWYYFLHRGLELLAPGGRLSFIVGAYWTKGRGAGKLIAALRQNAHLDEIFMLGRLQVFPNVAGQHLILTLTKQTAAGPTLVKTVAPDDASDAEPFVRGLAPVQVFSKTADQLFHAGGLDLEPPCDELLARLEQLPPLAAFGQIRQGIAENPASVTERTNRQHGNPWTVGEGVFVLTETELARLNLTGEERSLVRPYHDLCDLGRYRLAPTPSRWLIYTTAKNCPDIRPFPGLHRHLERFRPIMAQRRETRQRRRAWWQLHWPRDESLWTSAKLLCVQMAARPAFVPATEPAYVPFSVNVFVPARDTREHLYYLAAVLNSRLLWTWARHHAKRRGVGLELNGHVLARAPIRPIDFAHPADVARHDRLVRLVSRLLKGGQPREAESDNQIDRLVEELYLGRR